MDTIIENGFPSSAAQLSILDGFSKGSVGDDWCPHANLVASMRTPERGARHEVSTSDRFDRSHRGGPLDGGSPWPGPLDGEPERRSGCPRNARFGHVVAQEACPENEVTDRMSDDLTYDRRFSRAETADVIRKATELQQRHEESLTYDQLVQVASEVGIDQATVEATLRQAEHERSTSEVASRTATALDRCLEMLCLKPPARG